MPPDPTIDLTQATIWTPPGLSGPEQKAVDLLRREVEKRTNVRWPVTTQVTAQDRSSASARWRSLQSRDDPAARELLALGAPDAAEGYRILGSRLGGRLHRRPRCAWGVVRRRPSAARIADEPKPHPPARRSRYLHRAQYPLRGHQLAYRDKTNSYDGWDLPQWEQYICDMAVFGTNAIEMIPPRSDDKPDSVHFPRPILEMMTGVSAIADDYGIDVWLWYPALDEDYTDPATVEFALNEWAEVFAALPRIDAIMVPGGDPGHTPPGVLMALLEKQTANLRRFHPHAQMWVSPQGYSDVWMAEFLELLAGGLDWLTGVVYGPWVYGPIDRFRERIPDRYPIRNYPDITHSLDCQLPVPDWDVAYAITEGREVINPRPLGEAALFRHQQPSTIGFVSYSEGCHDDVNKMVWSGWGGILTPTWSKSCATTAATSLASNTRILRSGLAGAGAQLAGAAGDQRGRPSTLQQFHRSKLWRRRSS